MDETSPQAPRQPSTRVIVIALLGLALAVRLAAAFTSSDFPVNTDAEDYLRHGRSIAAGEGYPRSVATVDHGPTALRPPVYPYFLGAVFAVAGERLTAVRIAQAVLGTITVGLLGVLAWRLFGRRDIGLIALALGALYPPFVLLTTSIMSETVFLFLELAALVAAWEARRDARYRFAVIAGVLAGAAWLTRETGVVVIVAVVLAVVTGRALRGPQRLTRLVVVVGVAAATLAPWTIRNAVEMDAFIPVGLQTGLQLAGVYNDESRNNPTLKGAWRPPTTVARDAPLFRRAGIGEVELNRELTRHAVDYARAHPGYVLDAVVRNGLRMLHLGNAASEDLARISLNLSPRLARVDRFAFYLVAVLAIIGSVTAAVRRAPWWFWLTPLLFFGAAAASAGLVRYRIPADPFVLLAASAAVATLWDRVRAPAPPDTPVEPAAG